VIKSNTTIVIAQNGIGNEDLFREKYPQNSIISCAIWIKANQDAPGVFSTLKSEHTALGLFHNPQLDASSEQERVETYTSLLRAGGNNVSLESNIQIKRWEKVVGNVLWNPVSVITRQNMGIAFFDSSPEAERFGKALMLDVIAIGRRAGIPLDESLAGTYIEFTRSLGSVEPSMLYDLRAGLPLEIDVIVGTLMRKAREFEMEVPTLSAVYALVMAVNVGLVQNP
jgi:2-dehydropantoate 2-reductase